MSASNEDDNDIDDEGDDNDHRQVTADPETLAPTNQLDSRAITWLQSLGGEVSLVIQRENTCIGQEILRVMMSCKK